MSLYHRCRQERAAMLKWATTSINTQDLFADVWVVTRAPLSSPRIFSITHLVCAAAVCDTQEKTTRSLPAGGHCSLLN